MSMVMFLWCRSGMRADAGVRTPAWHCMLRDAGTLMEIQKVDGQEYSREAYFLVMQMSYTQRSSILSVGV